MFLNNLYKTIFCINIFLCQGFGYAQTPSPNVIIILTDDQPYGYMRCTGNPIVRTPNLDQLASDGTLFTNADIAIYRSFVESPLEGKKPVFEELFNLKNDPAETPHLIDKDKFPSQLTRLKKAWKTAIKEARGTASPKVIRYAIDSRHEVDHQQ